MAEVETERLRLRPFVAEDIEEFASFNADPEVMRYIWKGRPLTREESERSLSRVVESFGAQGYGLWAAVLKASGRVVGFSGLNRLEDTPEIEVAYRFARDSWGKGLATEAAHASLRYGFEEVGLRRAVAVAHPENVGSRRVLEKIGMKYERDAHHYGMDVAFYAVAREDFAPGDAPYAVRRG